MKLPFLFCVTGITGLMLFSACSKSAGEDVIPTPEPNPTPDPVQKMEINIAPSLGKTKANDYGFETGDCIGLYVVNYDGSTPGTLKDSGNHVDNMRFTYSEIWTPDEKIYWEDNKTHADIYLVYPYADITSVGSMPFSIKTNQSDVNAYKASDLMIGKTADVPPTEEAISIVANHMLSQVVISLQAGNGFTTESLASADVAVKINGMLPSASVDIASASLSASGIPTSVIPLMQNDGYKALVVPQTVSDTDLITVTVDGKEFKIKKGLTFEGGRCYNFTITLSKTSAGINVNIGPWVNDGEDYGGIAE